MTTARDRIHIKYCPSPPAACDTGKGEQHENLDYLLDLVEDDRVHAEAEKLRNEAKLHEQDAVGLIDPEREMYLRTAGAMTYSANLIDPYEQRDGQLVRKSDGRPVQL